MVARALSAFCKQPSSAPCVAPSIFHLDNIFLFCIFFVVVVLLYEKFVLVSRPNLNCSLGVWRPYASVLGAYYGSALYHQFNDLNGLSLPKKKPKLSALLSRVPE
jgi:hypothetical protein